MNSEMTNGTTAQPAPDFTMTDYVAADADGRIVVVGFVPRYMIAAQVPPEGGSVLEGAGDPLTDYVAAGAIARRPVCTAALDGTTLKSLPVPCTITIDGTAHDCTDDHCDLSFSHPGTYRVTVSAWPMLDATFEVTQA
ncbi:hypothetical protein AB6809_30010 [Paraburkholderia sp. RCC_158]|uniref:hypothetical protein n=1 Tax=Paraburkholderia sp. RCC_158 TaxID=3239220 RepID=UPI003523A759